jgi:hypothetical protein
MALSLSLGDTFSLDKNNCFFTHISKDAGGLYLVVCNRNKDSYGHKILIVTSKTNINFRPILLLEKKPGIYKNYI